jgi:hypothetical protein
LKNKKISTGSWISSEQEGQYKTSNKSTDMRHVSHTIGNHRTGRGAGSAKGLLDEPEPDQAQCRDRENRSSLLDADSTDRVYGLLLPGALRSMQPRGLLWGSRHTLAGLLHNPQQLPGPEF